jgi:hypothetical protein
VPLRRRQLHLAAAQFGRTRERAVENYVAFIDDALEAGASLVAKA